MTVQHSRNGSPEDYGNAVRQGKNLVQVAGNQQDPAPLVPQGQEPFVQKPGRPDVYTPGGVRGHEDRGAERQLSPGDELLEIAARKAAGQRAGPGCNHVELVNESPAKHRCGPSGEEIG